MSSKKLTLTVNQTPTGKMTETHHAKDRTWQIVLLSQTFGEYIMQLSRLIPFLKANDYCDIDFSCHIANLPVNSLEQIDTFLLPPKGYHILHIQLTSHTTWYSLKKDTAHLLLLTVLTTDPRASSSMVHQVKKGALEMDWNTTHLDACIRSPYLG